MRKQPPLILCPTHYERRHLRGELSRLGIGAEFDVCGVGPGSVNRWLERSDQARVDRSPAGRRVILAGIAGGLDPSLHLGFVATAGKIVGAGAEQAAEHPSFFPTILKDPAVTIASVDRVCATPADKQLLRERTGASLVDMESGAFAAAATVRGWKWGVVRGVSDRADHGVDQWLIDILKVDGSVDAPALLRAICASPRRLAMMVAINRFASATLAAVAREIDALLRTRHTEVPRPTRTLVIGGTFDPPHRGHAVIAAKAAEFLKCGRILVVPCATNPLRRDHHSASGADRLEMCRRAFAGLKGAVVDPREVQRGGPSFTIDTLREIARELSLAREDLVLLIGSDSAMQFEKWKEWRELEERVAMVAVVARKPAKARDIGDELCAKFDALGSDGARWRAAVLPVEAPTLSATQLRAMLTGGEPLGDLVDPAVEEWIGQRGLYA